MTRFPGHDGTELAYRRAGEAEAPATQAPATGPPVICLPGGPMRASAYLGDLGGLSAYRSLVLLDLRGTGASAEPTDPASYRCDRQVEDVEALRRHLGLDRIDLLGHSAGANLAVGYAARYPGRIGRLVLITPSTRGVDLEVTSADRRQIAELRHAEPWFPPAFAALEHIVAGAASDADWEAIGPFMYGRWDEAAHADAAAQATERNADAAGVYGSDGAFDSAATRAALADLDAPVLVFGGGYDIQLPPRAAAAYAALFRRAELVVQPGAGHSPWLDDPAWFSGTVARFLNQNEPMAAGPYAEV